MDDVYNQDTGVAGEVKQKRSRDSAGEFKEDAAENSAYQKVGPGAGRPAGMRSVFLL